MREVGILEAKTHLSALVDEVERGGEAIVITRHGRRVARLTPDAVPLSPAGRPRLSGEELVDKVKALRARMLAENPALAEVTWEELKQDMRR